MNKPPRETGRARGFTLLEILVAFAVLAVSLGVAFEIFSTGMRTTRSADRHSTAILFAESKLEGIGIEQPLTAGQESGDFDGGYRWNVDVQPREEPDDEGEPGGLPIAYQVTVTVSWSERGGNSAVTLTTLRLAGR